MRLPYKMSLLYKNNSNKTRVPNLSTNEALAALITKVADYFTVDRNTLRDNFAWDEKHPTKRKIENPQPRFKNLLAIAYAGALDFDDYYARATQAPKGIEGDWVSVVRSNDQKSLLLAKIDIQKEEDGTYWVEMIGGNQIIGRGCEKNKCLQILFEQENKTLLLSFFVGRMTSPKLLQGTFSGISSAGVPVAGVEWLVRPQLLPKNLQVPDVMSTGEGSEKWQGLPSEIQRSFGDFACCYVKTDISNISHFNWRDFE